MKKPQPKTDFQIRKEFWIECLLNDGIHRSDSTLLTEARAFASGEKPNMIESFALLRERGVELLEAMFYTLMAPYRFIKRKTK